jgi:hypothetical protein
MKFCKDCAYCLQDKHDQNTPTFWQCSIKVHDTCLVSGKVRYKFCEYERSEAGDCGVDGKCFQPKQGD